LESIGLELKEIDRYLNLVNLMKRTTKINLQQNTGPKKKLVMRFIQGALKGQEILLDTEELPIIFGKQEANQESGNMKNFRKIEGDKIVDKHFEIDYDKIGGTIMLRNLNFDCEVSCGLYKMLYNQEFYSLQPGDAFRIGSLEFLTERFNTAIIKDICHREHMEDYMSYVS
jgi:serine/threonine protein phosphatase PrpC